MVSSLSPICRLLIMLIKSYQLIISPLLGPHCRFQPTCSQYSIEALRQFGVMKGCWLILRRLLKCHPMNVGGHDPVPSKINNNREY